MNVQILGSIEKMRDIVTKTLYRSLLRVARNFESPSPIGSIVSSLLYRHGRDDWIDYERLSGDLSLSKSETSKSFDEESYNFNQHFASKQSPHLILYKSLLREILGGPKVHMKFAIQTKERKLDFLTSVIQREFRNDESSKSFHFGATNECRKKVGFMAYKELNQKLKWAETMGLRLLHDSSLDADANDLVTSGSEEDDIRITQSHVSVLWKQPPSTYLQPGCFLVAHPLLTGIFNQSVICILDHSISNKDDSKTASSSEKKNNDDSRGEDDMSQGTYGLILNHPFMVDETKYDKDPNPNHIISISERERQLNEIIRNDCLPEGMKVAFGNFPVRNGGPVNMSVQMLRIAEPTQESNLQIGGTVLPEIQVVGTNHEYSTAINDDRAIYFGGDIIKGKRGYIFFSR